MAIGDDWTIDYNNKRIYHSSGTTVHTVRTLYTYLQETFDELNQMDDDIPMSAQTPTEYTMTNAWFIDDESVKYLKGGAIATSGYDQYIHVVNYDSGTFTGTDLGKPVEDDGTPVGALLAYNNTIGRAWIREERGSWTTIADNSDMDVTGGSQNIIAYGNSITGEDLYANIYTLGTITSDPYAQIYVFQDGSAISEWSTLANWDRGHIDVLIKVKEADVEIDNGIITVYARQYGDNYDHFEIDLTNGGRNAVPLATSTDLNNTTEEYYLLYKDEDVTPSVGQVIKGATSGHKAEVLEVTDWGSTGLLKIGNVTGIFQNAEDLESIVGTTLASVNGRAGEGYLAYDGESGGPFTLNESLTIGAETASLYGLQDDGATGKMVITNVVGWSSDNDHIVGGGSSAVASVNGNPSYGIAEYGNRIKLYFVNATVGYDSQDSNFTVGSIVVGSTSKAQGYILADNDAGTSGYLTLANVSSPFTNNENLAVLGALKASCDTGAGPPPNTATHTYPKAFAQQSAYPYDVIIDCGGMVLASVYEYLKYITREDSTYTMYVVATMNVASIEQEDGEEYIQAYKTYSPTKTAPFGTFAGGVFFGARGVWVESMDGSDSQNYQLIDSSGNTRTPPNYQNITVTGLQAGDRVSVFRTTGDNYIINKAMYSAVAKGADVATIGADTALAVDTPTTGYVRVVDVDSDNIEYRHKYSSWTGSTFTLATNIATALVASDTLYVPFMDKTAESGTEQETVIYTSNRYVMCRVRKKGIIPFQTKGTFGAAGYPAAAIRTTDSIASS